MNKLDTKSLHNHYAEAIRLKDELSMLSDDLFDSGLDETSMALGVRDAIRGIDITIRDLDQRIQIS